jgi:hypothetical protein
LCVTPRMTPPWTVCSPSSTLKRTPMECQPSRSPPPPPPLLMSVKSEDVTPSQYMLAPGFTLLERCVVQGNHTSHFAPLGWRIIDSKSLCLTTLMNGSSSNARILLINWSQMCMVDSPQIGHSPILDKPLTVRTCSESGKKFRCLTARPLPQIPVTLRTCPI